MDAISIPDNDIVAPNGMINAAIIGPRNHSRSFGGGPSATSSSCTSTGFTTKSTALATRIATPIATSATPDENFVAISTPAAGPTMNDSSTEIESSENAGLRCGSGTIAVSACL